MGQVKIWGSRISKIDLKIASVIEFYQRWRRIHFSLGENYALPALQNGRRFLKFERQCERSFVPDEGSPLSSVLLSVQGVTLGQRP